MRHSRLSTVPLAIAFLFLTTIAAANTIQVTVNTSSLQGHPAAPFSLIFQLTDGSGTGDRNNTVMLSHFQFGLGSSFAPPTLSGGVTGNIASTVTFVDSSFLNYFVQPFTPGASLAFTVAMTNNVDAGEVPDGFAFSIDDKTGQPIPTQAGPFADMFLTMSFDAFQPSVETFAGDITRTPAGGGNAIAIPAPIVVAAVPEPASITYVALAVALSWLGTLKRRCHAGE